MLRYSLRRVAVSIPLVLGVLTLAFAILEAAPGSAVDSLLGDRPVPPDVRHRLERAYGLDRPAPERYVRWLGAVVLRGELGWSISSSRPVAVAVRDAVAATAPLAALALLVHVGAGVGLGLVTARHRDRWPDRTLSSASLALYGMPTFWVGLMAILVFAWVVPVFPAAGIRSIGAESWPWPERALDVLWHAALPATVLGLTSAAALATFVRSGLVAALGEGFVKAARARGLDERSVLRRHALRNALVPAIQLVGLSLPVLVSGSLVVEVVFAWPGMGRLAYQAVLARDVPVVLACTLVTTLAVVGGSLAADLAAAAADPRIRLAPRRQWMGDAGT